MKSKKEPEEPIPEPEAEQTFQPDGAPGEVVQPGMYPQAQQEYQPPPQDQQLQQQPVDPAYQQPDPGLEQTPMEGVEGQEEAFGLPPQDGGEVQTLEEPQHMEALPPANLGPDIQGPSDELSEMQPEPGTAPLEPGRETLPPPMKKSW